MENSNEIKQNIVHGFILPTGTSKVSDAELLALDDEQIQMMMSKLSYLDYNAWKLKILRKVLSERVEDTQWDSNSQQRIDFTMRSIRYVETILDRFKK